MSGDRHRCPCRCECNATAAAGVPLCWLCSQGIHSAGQPLRDHFDAGFAVWASALGITRGSSGFSKRQLARAAEAWEAWHETSRCPMPARVG